MQPMSTKSIVIWIVVIIVVLIGGYVVYKNMGAPATATTPTPTQTTPNQTASTSAQVQGQDVKVGTGALAAPGTIVSVLYVGKLQDGTTFDSSAAHGNQPLTFTLGAQGLIPGFQIGVNGMKVGGERQLLIPPSLGYGAQDVKDPTTGKVVIPANSTLLFDIKLVDVKASSTPATPTTPKKTK